MKDIFATTISLQNLSILIFCPLPQKKSMLPLTHTISVCLASLVNQAEALPVCVLKDVLHRELEAFDFGLKLPLFI